MDRYNKATLILLAIGLGTYGLALRHAYHPKIERPTTADQESDPRVLTEEEKQNFGPDGMEQDYGVFLDRNGKKCSTYNHAKSDAAAKAKHEPEYTSSLFYAVYGSCQPIVPLRPESPSSVAPDSTYPAPTASSSAPVAQFP